MCRDATTSTWWNQPINAFFCNINGEMYLRLGTMFKTTQLQLPPPKITIDFGVLRRPDPRKTIGDVRGMHKVYKSPGYYDLEVFGYVDGKCPHCKCTPKPNPNKLGVVKMVHTSGQNAARVKRMAIDREDVRGLIIVIQARAIKCSVCWKVHRG